MTVHVTRAGELDTATLYAILVLRSEVFVVEQECVYLDPDGLDLDPGTWHLWSTDPASGAISGYLRVLTADDDVRIGRVVVPASHRGRGVAAPLMAAAHELVGAVPVRLSAQAHLVGWYERFGYARTGPDYDEDGIMHAPMRREAA